MRRLIAARWAAVTLCALILVSAAATLVACPAMAARFEPQPSFGEAGTAPGQFEKPGAMAVEAGTGDVFVVDVGNERLEKFEPEANGKYKLVGTITGAELPNEGFALKERSGIAIDNSGGAFARDVYIASGEGAYQFKPKGSSGAAANEYEYTGISMKLPERFELCNGGKCETRDPGSPGSAELQIRSMVVTASGDVRVVDEGYYTALFNSATGAESGGVPQPLSSIGALVGLATFGNGVYVTGPGAHGASPVLLRFTETGNALEGETPIGSIGGSFEVAGPVAADAVGTAYALSKEGGTHVEVFAADAVAGSIPVEEFGAGEIGASSGIAYSSRKGGTVYVSDATADKVDVYTVSGSPPEVSGCGSTSAATTITVGCTIKPEAEEARWTLEYSQSGGAFTTAATGVVTKEERVVAEAVSLVPDTAYDWRMSVSNATGETKSGGEAVTSALPPIAVVAPASGVFARTAVLNGTVDPENSLTTYRFEYGACGSEASCSSSPYTSSVPGVSEAEAGAVYRAVAVSQQARELLPGTLYHYRLVAVDLAGEAVSGEGTFTTVPLEQAQVATGEASDVTQSAATLFGTIDPQGQPANYAWEIGTSSEYGTTIFGSAGSEEAPTTIMLALGGLLPGTTYHYRLVATDSLGAVYGSDHTFTTEGPGGLIAAPAPVQLLASVPSFPTVDSTPATKQTDQKRKACETKAKRIKKRKKRRRAMARCRKQ